VEAEVVVVLLDQVVLVEVEQEDLLVLLQDQMAQLIQVVEQVVEVKLQVALLVLLEQVEQVVQELLLLDTNFNNK
jgi:hypothetical protein